MNPRKKIEVINQDRRDDRRYPLELELRYKVVARSRLQLNGSGRTLNMSSGGVLFGGDQSLPAGAFVELSIHWPVLLQDKCPLTLLIVGRVVRSEANTVAVKTSRYEFVTRPGRSKDVGTARSGNSYIA